jgi:ABC-type uncharacterized transport system fused permease/ATPase subunit
MKQKKDNLFNKYLIAIQDLNRIDKLEKNNSLLLYILLYIVIKNYFKLFLNCPQNEIILNYFSIALKIINMKLFKSFILIFILIFIY